jgi:hypothetical protein
MNQTYSDGINVRFVTENDFSELRKLFQQIWLIDNNLYSTLKVTVEEINPYIDILFHRLKYDPYSASIGVDTLHNSKIVSFCFGRDFFFDPIPSERFHSLSPSIQTILQFNQYITSKFHTNSLFAHFPRKPHSIYYGLHSGTLPEYANRSADGFGTISERVAGLLINQILLLGYVGLIGVSTHKTTVDRSYDRIKKGTSTIIFSVGDHQTWVPKDGGSPPFRTIASPPMSVATLDLFLTYQSPITTDNPTPKSSSNIEAKL